MATYFLDSSAIVKRYVNEKGHSRIISLCDPANGHELYISQVALVEVVRAICVKAGDKLITDSSRDNLINIFRQDSQGAYGLLPLSTAVCNFAGDLCRSYSLLRSYDAVQLASVLLLYKEALSRPASPPTFVTADRKLITIAANENLRVEDPENYS